MFSILLFSTLPILPVLKVLPLLLNLPTFVRIYNAHPAINGSANKNTEFMPSPRAKIFGLAVFIQVCLMIIIYYPDKSYTILN